MSIKESFVLGRGGLEMDIKEAWGWQAEVWLVEKAGWSHAIVSKWCPSQKQNN